MAATQTNLRWTDRIKSLIRIKDFRLMLAAGGLDNTGRWMDTVVMGLLVLDLTDSAFQVALLFVFRWIPMLAFALVSGMVADRANRWIVMLVARTVAVAATAVMLVLVLTGAVEPWHVFIISFFLGWLFVLEFPSRRSLIYDLVGSSRIVNAMSLESINSTLGRLAGPSIGGILIELTGFSVAYTFLLVIYVMAWVLVLLVETRVKGRPSTSYSFWTNLSRGFKYSVNNSVIRGVLIVTLIMNALAFSVESLFPVVARDHLGVGAGLTGVLISAQAIGSLAAASVIATLASVRYHGRIFCLGLSVQLVSLLFFALSPWYPLSFVMLMLSGLGSAGYSTMQSTIILISAEPEIRGAALGMLGQCIGVAAVGGLAVGVVANFFSAQAAVAMSVSLGLVLMVPAAGFSPLIRRPVVPPAEKSVDGTKARPD